jgi:hypothetical protein
MRAIYNAEINELKELSEVPKPVNYIQPLDHGTGHGRPNMQYWAEKEKYDAHELTLKNIPCSEQCRSIFKDGQFIEEGKDFKVGCPVDETKAYCQYPKCTCTLIAHPINKDNTNEDDLWAEIWKAVRKEAFGRNVPDECIAELKKKYHITLK